MYTHTHICVCVHIQLKSLQVQCISKLHKEKQVLAVSHWAKVYFLGTRWPVHFWIAENAILIPSYHEHGPWPWAWGNSKFKVLVLKGIFLHTFLPLGSVSACLDLCGLQYSQQDNTAVVGGRPPCTSLTPPCHYAIVLCLQRTHVTTHLWLFSYEAFKNLLNHLCSLQEKVIAELHLSNFFYLLDAQIVPWIFRLHKNTGICYMCVCSAVA